MHTGDTMAPLGNRGRCAWWSASLLAATLVACGSSTTSPGGPGSDASTDSGNPAGCPASPPGGGENCSQPGLSCSYCGISATCTNGHWEIAEFACQASDASVPSDSGTDGIPSDASSGGDGGCPSSCKGDGDCASCPQKQFGGWSCDPSGVCVFHG